MFVVLDTNHFRELREDSLSGRRLQERRLPATNPSKSSSASRQTIEWTELFPPFGGCEKVRQHAPPSGPHDLNKLSRRPV